MDVPTWEKANDDHKEETEKEKQNDGSKNYSWDLNIADFDITIWKTIFACLRMHNIKINIVVFLNCYELHTYVYFNGKKSQQSGNRQQLSSFVMLIHIISIFPSTLSQWSHTH